jgi:hypothetical protein
MLRFIKVDSFLFCGALCVIAYLAHPLSYSDPLLLLLLGMLQSITIIIIHYHFYQHNHCHHDHHY